MHSHSWDDLRIVLAVAKTGSVSAAAKSLGVAHTTILRRITAFEAETGARLFEKTARGYVVSPDKLKVFEALTRAGKAIDTAQREISATAVAPGEALRLTSTDTLCTTVLPKVVGRLKSARPELKIALFAFNTHLDLAHGQADVTVRPAEVLPNDLEGVQAAHLGFCVYSVPGGRDQWLGLSGPLQRSVAGKWMEAQGLRSETMADSFLVLRELAAAGQGRGLLPCILGDADPRLQRQGGKVPRLKAPLWVAGHRDMADTGRLKRLRRQLVEEIGRFRDELAGRD